MPMSFICPACKKDWESSSRLSMHITRSKTCSLKPVLKKRSAPAQKAPDPPSLIPAEDFDIPEPPIDPIPDPPPAPARVTLKPTRTGRTRFLPKQLQDNLPSLSRELPHTFECEEPPAPAPAPVQLHEPSPSPNPEPPTAPAVEYVNTKPDEFGIYRSYPELPNSIPNEEVPITDVCEGAGFPVPPPSNPLSIFGSSAKRLHENVVAPFLNITVFRLMRWFYNGSQSKSIADLDALVQDVLLPDDFSQVHLEGFSTQKVMKDMDEYGGPSYVLRAEDGWIETSVKIPVPCTGVRQTEADAPQYELKGIFYRKPLKVLKATFQSPESKKFHYTPFKMYQSSSTANSEITRLHSELYNSDSFIEEHERIQKQDWERRQHDTEYAKSDIPNAIAGLMAWSDATKVGQWGDESMWPIYLYFGNQSKYERTKPSSFAAHHLAYIPKLPDDFNDFYKQHYGKAPTEAVLTHIRRELIQAIWDLILDAEFMHAYEHGIVLRCSDGVIRRLFPRLFTYSADYPEKVLLASIRSLATCPCPHCLVEKDQIDQLGTKWDRRRRETKARIDSEHRQSTIERIRKWIFDAGRSIASDVVETFLKPFSWIPTRNTFSERFLKFGANFYNLLVPDVLHELELGVWKALLLHLIRMLVFLGNEAVQKMNERYRHIPPFGHDTIRKIQKNVSAMKRMAARDYEDYLQVSMPVFEGLFPDHEKEILDLLFDLNAFHSFAKLRLHSDTSLSMLDDYTTNLGKSLRAFEKLSAHYDTKELPKEVETHQKRKTNKKKKDAAKGKGKRKANDDSEVIATSANVKRFNLRTYKIHALGHYVHFIRLFGTTDNYSTQIGELEHRRVKRFYARTNKAFKYVHQVTAHERHTRIIQTLDCRLQEHSADPRVPFEHSDQMQPTEPHLRYNISNDKSQWVGIHDFMNKNSGDPAVKSFLKKLKEHLFCRLAGVPESDSVTDEQRDTVDIKHNRMYKHKVLRVNYTTYDMWRCQDSINPRTRPDIMVLASDDDHPYWYARVVSIYHVMVQFNGGSLQRVDFLFVRWFGLDTQHKFGWKHKRLPQIGFIDGHETCAFGFVDPACVIRAVHLIPAFSLGRTSEFLGPSMARLESENDEDWYRYYIGMFADRDMVVRFCPTVGLGHNRVSTLEVHAVAAQEDGDPDANNLHVVEQPVPVQPPNIDDGECNEDAVDKAEEWDDFGYGEEDDEQEEHEDEKGEDADLGPEDGEDPVNHDVEVLDQEGYGML
ncbi:hypothetical protein VKT23_016343 [Stygiomarasmius scandens]|uniref:C2H2-type domain-containing protein n=1 Tax=Marasmiellus scandens TaxID=2682957 RepID=A0ABR1IV81_9AGAR